MEHDIKSSVNVWKYKVELKMNGVLNISFQIGVKHRLIYAVDFQQL